MLRIEVAIMSGRPNPEWIVTDADQVNELLGEVAGARGAVAKIDAGHSGLGFRELRVSVIEDDPKRRRGVPAAFALASTAAEDLESSGALARRLVEQMTRYAEVRLVAHEITPLTAELRDGVLERLERYLADPPRWPRPKPPPRGNPLRTTIKDERCTQCEYE